MGLFSKLKDLFQANTMDLISKAEDPEKMLNLYVERATEEVHNFQIQVNRALANKIQLEERIEGLNKEIKVRSEQAALAVQQGKDDLARTALTYKNHAESNKRDYESQLAEQAKSVEDLQDNLHVLTEKLEKAKIERNNLVMRQRRAETMKRANEAVSGLSTRDPLGDFDRMKGRVERIEAEAKVSGTMVNSYTIEDQFAELETSKVNSEIEDELAQLKAGNKIELNKN
ncbi:phage shock protein A (IM30), suppresses sigma54-dependent transcription [Desulfosporosinus acidiphilus SJ4]|uniref:Phage shock protein A (IM30), suppresses sigma54-dependent transcription n=1 Tax=Desulfosporosinus acidiphilus (strain DSM 22704 / JCM 16185 / SJ4) TaxID=646529 RepID=I4D3L4_DESAJ|nr:PspA/IM30 family protein [Desulfosporosinus acidiphilus]AFM40388.1 phage shock protein A (IM30), suppresses sigma54-dependent transcription [Desulfosporosinus acidiphilus SJ4]